VKNVFHSIIFGFKEMLTWNTMKYALFTSFLVIALWSWIGYLVWDILISISSNILDFVPFSMVRDNGAWMLSTFLWLQAILITFALIFSFGGGLLLRNSSKEKYGSYSFIILLLSTLFWTTIWFLQGDYIYNQFLQLLTSLPFQTIEKGIAFLISFYIIYNAIIITMLFITSIFNEPLIIAVEKRHFKEEEIIKKHIFSSTKYTLKDIGIFLIISIILFPLLFVPILNIIIQISLWIFLIKNTISYDAISLVYNKINKEHIKEHRVAIWFISFVTALFNIVPILNIFASYFGEITMFHYFKSLKNQQQKDKK